MNNSKVLTTLSFKATKESMLPIDKLEKLVGKCMKKKCIENRVLHHCLKFFEFQTTYSAYVQIMRLADYYNSGM